MKPLSIVLTVSLVTVGLFGQATIKAASAAIDEAQRSAAEPSELAALYFARANLFYRQNAAEKAIADYNQCIASLGDAVDPLGAQSHHRIGYLLLQQAKLDDARSHLELALDAWRQMPKHDLDRAKTELVLARCVTAKGDLEFAERLCRSALETRQQRLNQSDPLVAHAGMALARVLAERGAPDVLDLLKNAKAIYQSQQPPDSANLESVYTLSGSYFLAKKQYAAAADAFRNALDHVTVGSASWQSIQLLLGEAYLANRQSLHAEPCFSALVNAPSTAPSIKGQARFGLARIYKLWSNDADATEQIVQAMPEIRKLSDRKLKIQCLIHYAQLLHAQQLDEEARQLEAEIILYGGSAKEIEKARGPIVRVDQLEEPDPLFIR